MEQAREPQNRTRLLRVVIGVVILAGLVLLAQQAGDSLPDLAAWVDDSGAWGPLAFVLVYALAVVAFVPGSLLTLAGGALFGILWGTLYVFVAAVLGSSGAFLVARYLARQAVEHRLQKSGRFEQLDRAIGEQGLKIVFLLRLSPAFPFNLLNYAIGLSRISLRDYLFASVGMLPATVLYVYYGKIIGDVAAIAGGVAPERGSGYYAVLAIGLAATLAVTTLVTWIARNALREASVLEKAEP